jgi:hypothetical protein
MTGLDYGTRFGRRRMRHIRRPAGITLPQKRGPRRLSDRKTLDGSECGNALADREIA